MKHYDQSGNPTSFPQWYDNYFVPRGYAGVEVDMTGTNKSGGYPTSGGAGDVLGVKAVIDWLNGRAPGFDASGRPVSAGSWTTSRTGMIGLSYDATLAAAVAGTGVRGLAMVVPLEMDTSVYDQMRANGTISFFRDSLAQIAARVGSGPPEKCAAVRQALSAGTDDATANYSPFWDERWADDTVTSDAYVIGRGMLAAKNRESLSYSLPMTPGKAYEINWSMLPSEYLLESGHRLGLVLAGTDADLPAAETPTGATVTVDLGGSLARVPVVANEAG